MPGAAVVVGTVVGEVVGADVVGGLVEGLEVVVETLVVEVTGAVVVESLPPSDEHATNAKQPKPSALSRPCRVFTTSVSVATCPVDRGQGHRACAKSAGRNATCVRKQPVLSRSISGNLHLRLENSLALLLAPHRYMRAL